MLRFLKIITPVNCVIPHYDGYIAPPKEGDFHRTQRYGKAVWNFNIDQKAPLWFSQWHKIRRGFQMLWDT